jgi:hypothetical protein
MINVIIPTKVGTGYDNLLIIPYFPAQLLLLTVKEIKKRGSINFKRALNVNYSYRVTNHFLLLNVKRIVPV